MGAGVGMLYAGAVPHKVSDLVMIDFVKPLSFKEEDQPQRMGRAFKDLLATEEKVSELKFMFMCFENLLIYKNILMFIDQGYMHLYQQKKALKKACLYLNQLQETFLARWFPSVNMWYTNCTALGTYVI